MKKNLLILCALLLTAVGVSAEDHSVGDIVYHQDKAYKITGTNMVTNGSFEDSDMNGWMGTSYTNTSTVTGYTRYESGGYDGGAYVQFQSGSSSDASTPHQAIAVTSGVTYYFEGYTKGAVTSSNYQYNGLFWMKDSNTEDGTAYIKLDWHSASSTWTKTTGIFTPSDEHPYVGLRFGWSSGTGALYDGFQIYTVEETDADPTDTDSDHSEGDVVTVEGKHYSVKSNNKIENHSFELGYEGWTNSSDYTTTITSDYFNLETDDPQNGMRYLVGTGWAGSSAAASLGTAWPIEESKTYYFSYYVKNLCGATETSYLVTSLTDEPGTETSSLGYPATVSSDWQHVEYVFDSESFNYVQIKFRWLATQAGVEQWGFDNFQLYEVEPVEELLPDDCDYEEGDEIEMSNFKGTVVGTNLFVNGGFNNGVDGWTAGNTYTDPLSGSAVTFTEEGGYNDGQYVTIAAEGASDSKTPTQAIAVTQGKSYLLVGYTKYSGSDANLPNSRYSALFAMQGETEEAHHYENGTSYSNDLVELQFENSGEWVKTEGIFTVPAADADSTFSYVGMRMNWSTASYDGLQLYELDGEFTFPEDTDYKTNDVVTVDGTVYTVKGANLVENGSFNERTTGWTYGRAHTNPLGASQVTYNTDGGYNDGPYITSKGGGSDADTTPSKEVDVETGNTYLFVGYTNGTAPSDTNKAYNGLFKMSSATSEEEGVDAIVTMNWGDPDEELNGWTKTEAVFTAPTDYVSIRFAWCPGASFDGIQIYEVEATGMEWEMTDAGWGTMILPFAVETVPSGLTMYAGSALTLDTDGTTIMVGTAAETIAANTPYLVSGTEGTYTFTGVATNTEDSYQVGMLVGTLVDLSQDAGLSSDGTEYVLQNHTEAEDGEEAEGLAFYPITEESTGVTLNAYHCYLTTTANVSALHLPGMATGIETVESEQIANDAIYDLSGRRVAKAVNGVYIMNGKKVLVK